MADWWTEYKAKHNISEPKLKKTKAPEKPADMAPKEADWWTQYKEKESFKAATQDARNRAAVMQTRRDNASYLETQGRSARAYYEQLDKLSAQDAGIDKIFGLGDKLGFNNYHAKAKEQERRYDRDAGFYQQMANDAQLMGNQDLYNKAAQGYGESYSRYMRAYDKAYNADMQHLQENAPDLYIAHTATDEDVNAKLEELNKRKAEMEGVYRHYYDEWANDSSSKTVEEHEAKEKAFLDFEAELKQVNEDIEKYTKAARVQKNNRGAALYEQYLGGGKVLDPETFKKIDAGKARYEADRKAAIAKGNETLDYGLNFFAKARGVWRGDKDRLEEAGWDSTFDTAANLTSEDENLFYALYADDPQKAMDFITYANNRRNEEYEGWMAEWAHENGWNTAGAFFQALGNRLGSGVANLVDPHSAAANQLARTGSGLLAGGSQLLNEWSGTIDTDLPILKLFNGKGLGDFYQLANSVLESGINAYVARGIGGNIPGDYTEGIAALGTFIMGSSASASDYNESIKRGLTPGEAQKHALAAGINEALFEYISMDKLLDTEKLLTATTTKEKLLAIFKQAGVEATEEFCTTIANRLADGAQARRDGYDSQIENRAKELIAMGRSRDEALEMAEKEWVTELINDAIGGFISGGAHKLGALAITAPMRAVNNIRAERAMNRTYGQITSDAQQAAMRAYAADNGIAWNSTENAATVQNTQTETEGTDSSPTAQNDNEEQQPMTRQEKREAKREQKAQAKSEREIGADVRRVQEHIDKQLAGKTVQEQTAIRDKLVQQYGEAFAPAVYSAIQKEARANAAQYPNAEAISRAKEAALEGVTDQEMRQVVSSAYDQAAVDLAIQTKNKDALGRYYQQLRGTGTGAMTMEAIVKGQDGQEARSAITGMSEDGKSVTLADGSTVAVKELQADADTMDIIHEISALGLGKNTDKVFQAYQKSGRSGMEGYRWIMDYTTAIDQGRTRRISLQEAIKRSSLDAETVMEAYEMGHKETMDETRKAVQKNENRPKRKGVTGRVANIDTSAIQNEPMSKQEREQFDLANQIFELLGVDVKWESSKTKNGKYVGANGSYLNGAVTLDIHAGRNDVIRDINSGILATTGHELTHFLQEYAPEQYQALKEFVLQQIVKNGKYGEATLERMIQDKQNRSSKKLTKSQAEDEVVADACQTMLRDSKALREFSEQKPGAAKEMIRWLADWFKKIKAAFSRSAQLSEQARFMEKLEKDVREAFGQLWDDALREAVRVHDEIGNMGSGDNAQNSDRDTAYLDAVERGDMETAQKMVDEAAKRAGYTIDAYHGTDSKHTVFDPDRIGSNFHSSFGGFYFRSTNNVEYYGKNTMHVFLKMENPMVLQAPDGFYNAEDYYDVSPLDRYYFAKSNKNDGIIVKHKKGNMYLVFDSEQIKSADPVTYDDHGNVIPLSERFNPEQEDIRYSERDYFSSMNEEQVQEELTRLQQEKATAREKQRSLEKTDEYKRLFQDVLDKQSLEAISAFNKWADESGYVAAVDRAKEVDARRSEGAKVLDALIDQRMEREEQEAIKKSGKSEAEYFGTQAVKDFGYTPYFYDAGYIVPNGKMLNFSGQKGRHFGSRGQDHRAIGLIYATTKGSAAMNRFMNQGNIRIMAESPGIDISSATPLTKEQYATIRRFINEARSNEYFNLDFSDERGNNIGSIEYEGRFTADRVLNDIRHFFETGEVRQPSGLSVFYSERDYDTTSDLELMEQAAEEWDEGRWNELLKDEAGDVRERLETAAKSERKARELQRKFEKLQADIQSFEGEGASRIAVKDFTRNVLDSFGIPSGQRTEVGQLLQSLTDYLLAGNHVNRADILPIFEGLVQSGKRQLAADDALANIREDLKGRRIYVDKTVREEFGDDYEAFRRRAFGLGITLTGRNTDTGIDTVNAEMADTYPGSFDASETDLKAALENIVDTADSGKTSTVSLLEALAEEERTTGTPVREQLQDMLDQFTRQIEIFEDRAKLERKARAGDAAEIAKLKSKAHDAANKLSEMRKERDALRRKVKNADNAKQKAVDDALRKLVVRDAKQLAEAVRQKQELADKLAEQIKREEQIVSGALKPPAMQKLLKAVREEAAEKATAHKEEVFQRYKERKEAATIRNRIANLKAELQRRLTNPTDRSYVPAELATSMVDLLDALDTSPREGTQAAAKYQTVSEGLRALAEAYNSLTTDEAVGWEYKSEYDEEIRDQIKELAKTMQGRNIRDLNLEELQQVYEAVKAIRDSMRQATKLLNTKQFRDIYEAIQSIVDQQKRMTPIADVGWKERNKRRRLLEGLSVMRAVEMMSGWERDSALYSMFQGVEQGQVDADNWIMGYDKAMRPLKTEKNEKAYRDALTKQLDFGATDKESGKAVKMTKLQAIQLYMTWQREQANDKLVHLQKGGATIRDAIAIQNGKGSKAASHTVRVTPELISNIENSLTEWDRAYMKEIRGYLDKEAKAVNRVLYALKHRVLTTEAAYMPYVVDKGYLETKLEGSDVFNLFVKTPGSTQALQKKAPQPVIIDGLDNMMARHVRDQAQYIGLALPIRDFAKVFNGRLSSEDGDVYTSLKKTIEDNFEAGGTHLLVQALLDIQNSGVGEAWKSQIAEALNRLHSSFVKAALLINPSVTIKQAASYIAAESVLSQVALERGNHPIWAKTDKSNAFMPGGLIAHLFNSPEGRTAQRIYDEIDAHTSMHYIRRQGMSHAELANEAQRDGRIKRAVNAVGARMEQNKAGHVARKAGEMLNPLTWIQRMDVATTATLWVACKEQAKLDGMKAGTTEYWNRVTELYERCLRETQPMYDGLHRTAHQKQGGGLMQYLFPFRTVPIQNHGQVVAAYETMKAMKGHSKEKQAAAKKFFAKTVLAQTQSAVVFSLMTFLAAALKRKTKKYRDEDEEFTLESFLEGLGGDTASTLFSVAFPMWGSEAWSVGSRVFDKIEGTSGYSYDAFTVGAVDMLNELATAGDKLFADVGKIMRGEDVSGSDVWDHVLGLMTKGAKIAGIPADTVKTYYAGIKANVQDAIEGRIPALNDETWERATAVNANRFYKAWSAGDAEKMQTVLDEVEASGKSEDSISSAFNARAKEAYEAGEISLEEYADYLGKTGMFDDEKISGKIKTILRDEFTAESRSEDETIDALITYCGMDEDKAWEAVQKWEGNAEHPDDEDYSWSKYDDLRAAIDANQDISGIVAELTAHGSKEKDIKDKAKEYIKEKFVNGEITEEKFKNWLARYCGITNREDAAEIVNDAKCKRDTGYTVEKLGEGYRAGDVGKTDAKTALTKYGGLTGTDADKKIRWWDQQKAHPDLQITEGACNNWYDGSAKTRENGHESAKAAGMSLEAYLAAKKELDKITDANGNSTGEDEYIAALAKMNLTPRQKDALYYEKYKGTTKYSTAKSW